MIRVVIADDHEFVREGVKKVLRDQPDIVVCGEAADGLEVLACIRDSSPDVLILDIAMPGRSGLDVLHDLAVSSPHLPVIVLSMHPEERFAVRALRAGAAGYVHKQSAAANLVQAVRKVSTGGRYVSQELAEQLARELESSVTGAPHAALSDREYQVFLRIAGGKTSQQIALELSVSLPTVKTYRMRIIEKTGLRSNAEIIRYALEQKLLDD